MLLLSSLLILLPFQQFVRSVILDSEKKQYEYQEKYTHFPESLRLEMLAETKKMFYFGYENYMNFAFPLDELNPIYCRGRGPDYANP